ncbi:hypothetical protein D3C72_547700 [compost metagenome]
MNIKRNLPLITIALILAGVITYLFIKKDNKVVYIDTIKLFNDFKYTKELEHSYEQTLVNSKNRYDSLAALAKLHPGNMELNTLLEQEGGRFSVVYEQIKETISKKSWERLDPLIKEFGNTQDYELLIGANGMGTVLYGKEHTDKTQQLIDFVNKKYEQSN